MKYTNVMWDFNGTLLDDVTPAIKTMNSVLGRRDMELIEDVTKYHSVFGFPIEEYYKKIGFTFENESYEEIAVEWTKSYLENAKLASLYDGTENILEAVKKSGISQIILSATEQSMLTFQVEELGIGEYFDEVLGIGDIYASSKVYLAKEWMERVRPDNVVFIGDTVHDFEVAEEIGADCILIASGHQSEEILKQCGCPVVKNIQEVLPYLN